MNVPKKYHAGFLTPKTEGETLLHKKEYETYAARHDAAAEAAPDGLERLKQQHLARKQRVFMQNMLDFVAAHNAYCVRHANDPMPIWQSESARYADEVLEPIAAVRQRRASALEAQRIEEQTAYFAEFAESFI